MGGLGLGLALWAGSARAVLDVENRGPQLTAAAFAMRITNIGALGNPFFSSGRSFDASFEYPRGSGTEFLNHAELWVGARDALGRARVSGGPLLEWRPTLDPADHVRTAYAGVPGTLRWFDDDGDGRLDEEFLDGRDDDGDGEVDEDLGLFATQTLFARYADDQPEAVNYAYLNGEQHVPLHLDVRQQAFCWALPGYDNMAGLHFVITNHGTETLTEIRMGLLVDLDSREAGAVGGHLDDHVRTAPYQQLFNDGTSRVPSVALHPPLGEPLPWYKACLTTVGGFAPAVGETPARGGRPAIAVVPLWHTTDPLSLLAEQGRVSESIIRSHYFAPPRVSFQAQWFANDLPPLEGGLPIVDEERFRALAGQAIGVRDTLRAHDYVALVSCGPFAKLEPGRSLEMDLALVVAEPESLSIAVGRALRVHHGGWLNLLPDDPVTTWGHWSTARSGVTGHDLCYEPPEGLAFEIDPHCLIKYFPDNVVVVESKAEYRHGTCVWSDLDCDACTGFDGKETRSRWQDPANAPAAPAWRTVPGDRAITVEWDDQSEVLQDVHLTSPANVKFVGYNIYRLDDWSSRRSELPMFRTFQQVASFGRDTTLGARPLAEATDTSVTYERILYERRVHPIGCYRWTDTRAINGFDYVYAVTAVCERQLGVFGGTPISERVESPILASLDSIVTPRSGARSQLGGAHVVPNPYRGSAPWERQPVAGDSFTRHVDFVGLPRGQSVIRIYTLAGDLVTRLDHDGARGGEQRWDLISRNGQDVAAGVYLFTVDTGSAHQVGRFVLLR